MPCAHLTAAEVPQDVYTGNDNNHDILDCKLKLCVPPKTYFKVLFKCIVLIMCVILSAYMYNGSLYSVYFNLWGGGGAPKSCEDL